MGDGPGTRDRHGDWPAAADRFAAESGLGDYAVGPISFHVDRVAVQLGRQPR